MLDPLQSLSPATAAALARARAAASAGILGPGSLSRSDRERLTRAGWLMPVMRGWQRLVDPALETTASTGPALILRRFLAAYLPARLGGNWCLSPLSSLEFLLEPDILPAKVVVIAAGGATTVQALPGLTTLTVYPGPDRLPDPGSGHLEIRRGLRLLTCEAALAHLRSRALRQRSALVRSAIAAVEDWNDVVAALPLARRSAAAAHLTQAVGKLGTPAARTAFNRALALAGIPEPGGARRQSGIPAPHLLSAPAHSGDLPAVWARWQEGLAAHFPTDPFARPALVPHLGRIADALADDTWHSLRLSGLHLTRDMVLACRGPGRQQMPGDLWPPADPAAAIAQGAPEARLPGEIDPVVLVSIQGHLAALERVKETILHLLQGAPLAGILPGEVAKWYAALLRPSTQAGLLPIGQLRRTRRPHDPIFPIAHRPCDPADIGPALDALYSLIPAEPSPGHRAVLAHLGILYVQPWSLGNGRMARLLMNALLAAGGQSWLTLPGERRRAYLAAVERALVRGNAAPLARLLLRA